MAFQPYFAFKTWQRQVAKEEDPQVPLLEATAMLPSVTGSMVRGSALPTASVLTFPGCTMRMSASPACRRCQGRARSKEAPVRAWQGKVGSANKHQTKPAPKAPVIPRQKRMALPQIPKGDKDSAKPGQKRPCLPARTSLAKAAPLGNHDMTPWAGPSQSETSFHALFKPMVSFLHSVPFSAVGSPSSCPFFPDLGEKALDVEGKQRQKAVLIQGKAKRKGRNRGSPRHLQSKWEGVTLPPVPSITNLSFSPNFTFSFFELPPHQSQQSWVQRQQLIRLLMKQLK
ncbi:uncharacterized protein [Anolis sagrei]|uniref:uncharacterized protein n=1 Tax=Anolis sagrei TaxID=38937 RepID=UPI00352271AB